LEGIKGAGAFVFTRANSLSSIQPVQRRIEESLGQPISPIILKSVPKQVQHLVTGQVRPLEFLLETPLLVVSGIGNPRSFRAILTSYGSEVCEEIQFPDHCAYGQDEVAMIRKKMDEFNNKIVVTTEKDAVKLREWFTKDDPFWVIITKIEFLVGEDYLLHLLDRSGFM
jgi:tetraacyldisaccharide-1-P 4'-kinase